MKIAALTPEDRPREKLLRLGPDALSDYELLALLLGSGTKGVDVLELSQRVLSLSGGIRGLPHADSTEWNAVKGIGKSRGCALSALAELLRRYQGKKMGATVEETLKRLQDNSNAVEEAYVLCVQGKKTVHGVRLVARGSESHLVVSPPEVLRAALAAGGRRFIFAHIHPSGAPYPSSYDIDMTAMLLRDAAKVGLSLVDHVVLTKEGSYSFKENGLILQRKDPGSLKPVAKEM